MVREASLLLPCDIWHAHNGLCNDRDDDGRTLVLQLGLVQAKQVLLMQRETVPRYFS